MIKYLFIAILLFASTAQAATIDIKLLTDLGGEERNIVFKEAYGPFSLKVAHAYKEQDSIASKDRGSLDIYYDRCEGKWCLWFFNVAEYKRMHDIRSNSLGAGPKYVIADNDHKLSFSTGVLYEYDHISDEGFGRYSHRPKYKYKDWITAIAFHQPSMDDSSDYINKYSMETGKWKSFKAYCQEENRSLIGVIESECGIKISIELGGEDGTN